MTKEFLDDIKAELDKVLEGKAWLAITLDGYGFSESYTARYPYFNVYVIDRKADLRIRRIAIESAYYDKRRGSYGMEVFGVDRKFELIYSIARAVYEEKAYEKACELDRQAILL